MAESIFITGGTGCIGSYVVDDLIAHSDLDLHLLVRDPKRVPERVAALDRVNLHQGDIARIEEQEALIRTMDYIVHIATDWSESDFAFHINVEKTFRLFEYCRSVKCKKIIYFSTASILGPGNRAVPEAGTLGSAYVRSKYKAYQLLQHDGIREKVYTVFPTMVFGGDDSHPYSHISEGIVPNVHYLKLLRFIYLEMGFHFLHSKDIAAGTRFIVCNDVPVQDLVFGTPAVTGKQAIKALCRAFGVPCYFQLKVPKWVIFFIAKVMRIEMPPWGRYCIENSDMTYSVMGPRSFGLEEAYPTLDSVLENVRDTARS